MSDTQIDLLNFVANQPEVLREVAPGYRWVDLSNFLENPKSLMFGNEHGLVIFAYLGDAIYEGHYLMTNTMPANVAMPMFRRALAELFTKHNASAINGATPRGNKTARAVNRALGFRPVGFTHDTMGRECIKYLLERKTWEAS